MPLSVGIENLSLGISVPITVLIVLISSVILFVSFVALHPKSTAMVMVVRSVHQTTLFPRQA